MLTTIATVLVLLWLIGFLGFHVLGGFIHILLVIAIIVFLIRIIKGENPVR
ncbi:MAG: lmo0937 family membrane protein [Patescibacteria group bacterium]